MAPTATPAEAGAQLDAWTVVDVRSPGEFAGGHIPGAHNVPLDRLGEALTDLRTAAARKPLLVVCASGNRAGKACETLGLAGVEGTLLTGGTQGWTDAGLPVTTTEDAPRVWSMDRQVRLAAGGLVLTGLLAGRRLPRLRLLSGAVAGGLVFSALTDTCGMAALLARLPHNRAARGDAPTFEETRSALRG